MLASYEVQAARRAAAKRPGPSFASSTPLSLVYLNPPRGVEGVVCYDPYLRDTRPFYCLAYRAITRRGQAAQKNRGSSRKKYM